MDALGARRVEWGAERAWQGVGWDGNVGPLIRAAGAFEKVEVCGKCGCACFQAAKSGSSRVGVENSTGETRSWVGQSVWLVAVAF